MSETEMELEFMFDEVGNEFELTIADWYETVFQKVNSENKWKLIGRLKDLIEEIENA